MTVDQLIAEVLNNLRNHFYAERVREFKRDERQLMKAIARYGYECERRGWHLQAEFICSDLITVLRKIRTGKAVIEFLPVYLEGTVDKHIGQRAEELSMQAKQTAQRAPELVKGLKSVTAIIEPTTVEVLGKLYVDLARTVKAQRRPPAVKTKQRELL
jgi:hypothetical protein